MTDLKKLFKEHYQLTNDVFIQELLDNLMFRHVDKNDVIITEGEMQSEIYFLIEGVVRGFYFDEKGNEVTDCFAYHPGECIASDEPMDSVATISEQALSPCELAILPIHKVYEWLPIYPDVTKIYIASLSHCLKQHRDHKIALSRYCAENRYRWMKQTYPELIHQVKKKYIASFLNITPQTMSILLRQERMKSPGMSSDVLYVDDE